MRKESKMLNDINIYPTLEEQKLLQERAAQHNMYLAEFITYIIRKELRRLNDNNH